MSGEVGYNSTSSEYPTLNPRSVKMIEGYDTFGGWVTDIISAEDTKTKCDELNAGPTVFENTPHKMLVQRVRQRLNQWHAGTIDSASVMDDMKEMYEDIMGRRERPPLPGWKTR